MGKSHRKRRGRGIKRHYSEYRVRENGKTVYVARSWDQHDGKNFFQSDRLIFKGVEDKHRHPHVGYEIDFDLKRFKQFGTGEYFERSRERLVDA